MNSGASVAPSHAFGGGTGHRSLRTTAPLPDRIGTAVRFRGPGTTR